MEDAHEKQQEKPPGNMIAWFNRQKKKDDNRPVFQGEITLPDDPHKRPFSLWATQSRRTKASMLTGRAGFSAAAQIAEHTTVPRGVDGEEEPDSDMEHEQDGPEQAMEEAGPEATAEPSQLDIKENDVVLFTNTQRDAQNPNRPDYWGYFNPGQGKEMMRLSVWSRTDRAGKAMLTGSVVPFGNALLKEKSKELEEEGPEHEPEKQKARSR